MAKNKVSPTELEDDVYNLKRSFLAKTITIAIVLLIIGLLSTFPIKNNIAQVVTNAIQSNRACPISFENVEVSFLLPSITVKEAIIEGTCFKNPASRLPLNDVRVYFYGPSFSPLGLRFKSVIERKKTDMDIYISVGLGSQAIRIEESRIDSELINNLLGDKIQLEGVFEVDSVFNIQANKLAYGSILLKSSSFSIPSQAISTFDVPHMPISNVELKATIKRPKNKIQNIEIMNFEMGSNESPILGQLKGPLKLNTAYPQGSEIDLKGKIKFSKNFMDNFAILGLFLGGKSTDDDGFYRLKVGGTFATPKPSFQ